jgi:hypothetical protein
MNVPALQKTLSQILGIGTSLVTIFLMIGSVTDPVNAPKMFLLGGVSGAALALSIKYSIATKEKFGLFSFTLAMFLIWSAVVVFKSTSPITQNIYGTYGRNTGMLTYCLLAGLAFSGYRIRGTRNFNRVIHGFLFALGVNLIYGLWVMAFGDFLAWNNIYGAILGTFGNPNFISSFLGMSFSAVLAVSLGLESRYRYFVLGLLPIIFFEMIRANSLQGFVVAILGTWLVGFFWLLGKFKSNALPMAYFGSGAFLGVVGIFGALGLGGPLKQVLAQPTVALREQYWLAAWHMGTQNPIFGVGMDSYGDWYRRARSPQALITPGPNTVTNVSHNVFLDLFASGGFPLLLLYLIFTSFGLVAIVRVARRVKNFDTTFVALTVIWVGFQAQSIISINQIGLAVWGWLLTGLLVGYEIDSRDNVLRQNEFKSGKPKSKTSFEAFSPQLVAFIGVVVGFLISAPPLSADIKWRSVQTSGQVSELENAFAGNYMSPLNSYSLASAVQLLENSNFPDLAIKYAREGIKFNPNSFDAWKMLYYATKSTPNEKSEARLKMIRLDPLNPEWKKLK